MNTILVSAFRDATSYLSRYFRQVRELRAMFPDLELIAGEGDSQDGTRQAILQEAAALELPCKIVDVTHGFPPFGSTEEPLRLRELSKVGDAMLRAIPDAPGIVVYVESDLIWDAPTLAVLIGHALRRADGFDVFAPLIFAGTAFYDIWAFRKDGERFSPFPPYHPGLIVGGLTEVESAGSCLVMQAHVAREGRMNDSALVGFCVSLRMRGRKIAVDASLRVKHPC